MLRLPLPIYFLPAARLLEIPEKLHGVYFFICNDEVIYVGQSRYCIRQRVKDNSGKFQNATYIAWHVVSDGNNLRTLENNLIEFWHPEGNTMGKPDQPHWERSSARVMDARPRFWEEYSNLVTADQKAAEERIAKLLEEVAY